MSEEPTSQGGAEDLRQNCCQQLESCKEAIVNSPTQSVMIATGAGFLLSKLPIFKLFALVVRLAFMALPPTLFVLGIMKSVELIRDKK